MRGAGLQRCTERNAVVAKYSDGAHSSGALWCRGYEDTPKITGSAAHALPVQYYYLVQIRATKYFMEPSPFT